MTQRPILIAGPTASGKSALALRLARERNGVVINADSMQVYADLRVITARPSVEEEALAPHRLYGHVDGAVNYSVGRYVEDAAQVLASVRDAGQTPILVGGTGLYFKALTEGLSEIPPVPQDVRDAVRAHCEGSDSAELHRILQERDPESAARLRPSDRLRIMRAMEVHAATGRSIRSFHDEKIPGPMADADTDAGAIKLFLAPDRAALRARIDERFEEMMGQGALDEVARLMARGLDPMLPVMRAHGVPGLIAHLRGELTLEEAIVRAQNDTRAYAKRQFTWFRNSMPGWTWAPPEDGYAAVTASG
jgi:tRNA dimethylallyltransferase